MGFNFIVKGSVERSFLPISDSAGVYSLCSSVDLYDKSAE